MTAGPDLDALARAAADGDRQALGELCRELQHLVYRLALQFFSSRQDAEDATQEILVKVITHLGSFEGRSKVTTWVHTIAVRHLLRARTGAVEDLVGSAEDFAGWIDRHLGDDYRTESETEYRLLCGEVRIACTYGMLLCLSRELRAAYLLGDLVGLTDTEGAAALGIGAAAFRQRLARARRVMRSIIAGRCGLVDARNPCRCSRQVESSLQEGIMTRDALQFATHPGVDGPIPADTLKRAASQLDDAEKIAELYRSAPTFRAPETVWAALRRSAPDLLA
ncbi:MAG TPA: RNA polymerase sigma factor [Geodermatophilus sp.]|nr:RNA polymerase sigma factor [Geodermatophilus sp.]